ncbi:hypothetical protein DFH05DRAFT_1401010 [Lentinula detonsa]|uniref:Uncharacterized protein n=1 Tax=Lentinula detonsa TaxID=2804962 RepID=A0A9W8NXY4_9AGAR|nr:hypothetical protein DFH05DRAFT_1401010 [Lentinula detonsa]
MKSLKALSKEILFDFNAQHDCASGECKIDNSTEFVIQEHIKTAKNKKTVYHSDDIRYLMNMHALHNAHLVREVLPRSLVIPIPLQIHRNEFHEELS